jgi:hypothetical protein
MLAGILTLLRDVSLRPLSAARPQRPAAVAFRGIEKIWSGDDLRQERPPELHADLSDYHVHLAVLTVFRPSRGRRQSTAVGDFICRRAGRMRAT